MHKYTKGDVEWFSDVKKCQYLDTVKRELCAFINHAETGREEMDMLLKAILTFAKKKMK